MVFIFPDKLEQNNAETVLYDVQLNFGMDNNLTFIISGITSSTDVV